MKGRLAALSGSAFIAGSVLVVPAHAEPASTMTCGTTVSTPCNLTAHVSALDSWQTPLGTTGPGCPSYLGGDYAHMVAQGNGVEHNAIDKSGEFSSAMTFEGTGTITLYDRANVDITPIGDGQDVTGAPTGPASAVLSGHVAQHFAVDETNHGAVFTLTFSFSGTDGAGQPVTIHVDQHANWTKGSQPFVDPPQHSSMSVHC